MRTFIVMVILQAAGRLPDAPEPHGLDLVGAIILACATALGVIMAVAQDVKELTK